MILHSCQQRMAVPVASHSHQHLVFTVLLILAILVVLIYISWIANVLAIFFHFLSMGIPKA